MARILKRRTHETYDNETHSRDQRGAVGDYTLDPAAGPARVIRPSYTDGPLIYRPWPALDPEDPTGNLLRGRKNANPRGHNSWIVRVDVAAYVGLPDSQVSFNLFRPGDAVAQAANPYRKFYRACNNAHDAGNFGENRKWDSDWNKLIKGSKTGGGAAIGKPKSVCYIQASVYANGKEVYVGGKRTLPLGLDPKDDIPVVRISREAGIGLLDLYDIAREDYDGDAEDDPALPYLYGDPTGRFLRKKRIIKGGNIVAAFNPAVSAEAFEEHSSWNGVLRDQAQGYESAILPNGYVAGKKTYLAALDAEATQVVFDKVNYWFTDPTDTASHGILRVESPEQQALWIVQAFGRIPKLVQFGLLDEHPEYNTDEAKAILRARVSAVVPGADEGEDEEEDEEVPQPKKKGAKAKAAAAKNGRVDVTQANLPFPGDDDDGDDEDEDEIPPPKPGKKGAKVKVKAQAPADDEDEDEDDVVGDDEEDEDAGDEDDDDEDEGDEDDVLDEDEDEDALTAEDEDEEEEEEEAPKPAPRKSKAAAPAAAKAKPKAKAKPPVAEDDDDEDDDDEDAEEDDDEDEDEPAPVKTKPAKAKAKPAKPTRPAVDDDEDDDDDDEPVPVKAKPAKAGTGAAAREQSLKAAKGRSAARDAAPTPPAPPPPKSSGGTAPRKPTTAPAAKAKKKK